MFNNHVLLIFQ